MNTKLTLTVDKEVIEQAKLFARSHGRSLSNLVEEYLKALIDRDDSKNQFNLSPLVESLWGSVPLSEESINYKELLKEEIGKKHLR